jgi:hypothetical protein
VDVCERVNEGVIVGVMECDSDWVGKGVKEDVCDDDCDPLLVFVCVGITVIVVVAVCDVMFSVEVIVVELVDLTCEGVFVFEGLV